MVEDPIFTTAIHAGDGVEDFHRSLSPPLYLSSAFSFPDVESAAAIHEGAAPGFFYGRMGTPTQQALEKAMCELEGGDSALALSSGMAAITTALFSLVESGVEVVAPRALYATTGLFLDEMLAPLGVDVCSVDARTPEAYEAAASERTRVFYLETPSNPTLQITDIQAVAAIARRWGIATVLDNTFATPVNQRPLDLGVDLVVHSATKYLGGHGDLVAGVIVGRKDLVERARWHTAKILGGTLSPLAAWLVLRGLRTLPLRMARHSIPLRVWSSERTCQGRATSRSRSSTRCSLTSNSLPVVVFRSIDTRASRSPWCSPVVWYSSSTERRSSWGPVR